MHGDEVLRVNRALVKASKHYRSLQHTLLAKLDLSPGQDVLLWHLSRHPDGLTVGELAETIGIEPPTVTRSLNRLGEGTWFVRERSPDDRRTVVIHPSARALDVARDVERVWEELARAATTGFTPTERNRLVNALERVRDNLADRTPSVTGMDPIDPTDPADG